MPLDCSGIQEADHCFLSVTNPVALGAWQRMIVQTGDVGGGQDLAFGERDPLAVVRTARAAVRYRGV